MELTERIQELLDLDELKSDTSTTKSIQEALKNIFLLDGAKKIKLQQLIEEIRRAYKKNPCLSEAKTISNYEIGQTLRPVS